MPSNAGTFELFREEGSGQFRWRLRAANGEIVAASEGYHNRQGAEKGIAAVKAVAPEAPIEDQT